MDLLYVVWGGKSNSIFWIASLRSQRRFVSVVFARRYDEAIQEIPAYAGMTHATLACHAEFISVSKKSHTFSRPKSMAKNARPHLARKNFIKLKLAIFQGALRIAF